MARYVLSFLASSFLFIITSCGQEEKSHELSHGPSNHQLVTVIFDAPRGIAEYTSYRNPGHPRLAEDGKGIKLIPESTIEFGPLTPPGSWRQPRPGAQPAGRVTEHYTYAHGSLWFQNRFRNDISFDYFMDTPQCTELRICRNKGTSGLMVHIGSMPHHSRDESLSYQAARMGKDGYKNGYYLFFSYLGSDVSLIHKGRVVKQGDLHDPYLKSKTSWKHPRPSSKALQGWHRIEVRFDSPSLISVYFDNRHVLSYTAVENQLDSPYIGISAINDSFPIEQRIANYRSTPSRHLYHYP